EDELLPFVGCTAVGHSYPISSLLSLLYIVSIAFLPYPANLTNKSAVQIIHYLQKKGGGMSSVIKTVIIIIGYIYSPTDHSWTTNRVFVALSMLVIWIPITESS